MSEDFIKLIKLMFDDDDTIAVSDSQFAYHAVPISSVLSGEVTLVSPNSNVPIRKVKSTKLILLALNPIKGFRRDAGVYKFKNFLLELDVGSQNEQLNYMKTLGIPYSAAIFSGSKSIHFLISLGSLIPNEKSYLIIYEWMLNVGSLFDQNCKNASRSIRICGALRPETGKEQELIEFKGQVHINDLAAWLNKHPEGRPKEKQINTISETPDFNKIKDWAIMALKRGIVPPNRNKQWFAVAVEFALAGYSESDTLEKLRPYFSPDRDFKEREWKITVRSAFKWTYERKE